MLRLLLTSLFVFSFNINILDAGDEFKGELKPLPAGAIQPEGWLAVMTEEAAAGYTGNMEGINADATHNKTFPINNWKNIREKVTSWARLEQEGYYLDGLARLAYILDDEGLIEKVKEEIDPVVEGQEEDGYFFHPSLKEILYESDLNQGLMNPRFTVKDDGEEAEDSLPKSKAAKRRQRLLPSTASRNLWSIAVFNRAVLALYDASGESKYIDFLERYYENMPVFKREVPQNYPISGTEMHFDRHLVNLENMFEVANRTGNDVIRDKAIRTLEEHASGMVDSWLDGDFAFTRICHGVTFNEIFKLYATALDDGKPEYLKASEAAFEFLKKEHLQAYGVNTANEYLMGKGGFTSTELCNVVDLSWSLIWMTRATGKAEYGDVIEQAFFNAFPASIDKYQQHVYVFGPNRLPHVACSDHRTIQHDFRPIWAPYCCTGNLNRALPNFIMNIAMRTADHGLAYITYGPNTVNTKIKGQNVSLKTETKYPFGDQIDITLNSDKAISFPLHLRIPEWCGSYRIKVNGETIATKTNDKGFVVLSRRWKDADRVSLKLDMKVEVHTDVENKLVDKHGKQIYIAPGAARIDTKAENIVSGARYAYITRGPLLFSLAFDEKNVNEAADQHNGYALPLEIAVNDVRVNEKTTDGPVWDWQATPIELYVKTQKIDFDFTAEGSEVGQMPQSTFATNEKDLTQIRMIPFGAAKFRLTYFPIADEVQVDSE
ncbi:glycoside hydrolase family 127 protein [Planctomycetota bacterium]|nr:glycoside hydrolase family 127 protein [Planctomycetota bacterium]